ncbi:acyl-CoA dehydrogenase family protein [Yinghuangia seranimata]|uniref:acyl-CoA dehydrogenase family protein n=1 Tax=Yinghuangia seranimata TaxID=408067 RepID=UPI00248ABE57|nr:acyl-CoA dehydrogenase family protein [Yinghuangia seranimata]MDI2130399.1 acyl-CoA dehydrogenase family protein [Yinghuangia seranimata]
MHLAPTPAQDALRAELREYFTRLITPDVREALEAEGESGGETTQRIRRQMGADGWLGIGWPVEYGGQGKGPEMQFIFFDEAYRAGAPVSMVTLNTVGPTLIKYGSEEQKKYFLPKIVSGEIIFAIGYSEPSAGTDLASLQTKAVREGDEWVINGQKIFTSTAQGADWIWLACRTDTEAPKHKGITMILVPTNDPGFAWTPIVTVGGMTTTATYYDNIRVPYGNLVYEENRGWNLITNQLNHERVALAALGMQAEDFFNEVLEWARATEIEDGVRVIDQPWVQLKFAETYARLSAVRMFSWRLVHDVGNNTLNAGDASGVKFFGTEGAIEVYRNLMEIVGPDALLRPKSPGAFSGGHLEAMNRRAQINTFGGGVSEVQREIVAMVRLGMTKVKR